MVGRYRFAVGLCRASVASDGYAPFLSLTRAGTASLGLQPPSLGFRLRFPPLRIAFSPEGVFRPHPAVRPRGRVSERKDALKPCYQGGAMDITTDPTTAAYWEVVLMDAIADWTLREMEAGRIEAVEPYSPGRRYYLRHKVRGSSPQVGR